MRPTADVNPEFIDALRAMLLRIQRAVAEIPGRQLPVRMTIAGGAALHCCVGDLARVRGAIDIACRLIERRHP